MTIAERLHDMHPPSRKTIFENAPAALLAAVLVYFGIIVIPTGYPMKFEGGEMVPAVGAPGDSVQVRWKQVWSDLCPISVTREFVGSDDFRTASVTFGVDPPPSKGVRFTDRPITLPKLPPGDAYYQATVRPHCLFDQIVHQRVYHSPRVKLLMVSNPSPGPR